MKVSLTLEDGNGLFEEPEDRVEHNPIGQRLGGVQNLPGSLGEAEELGVAFAKTTSPEKEDAHKNLYTTGPFFPSF